MPEARLEQTRQAYQPSEDDRFRLELMVSGVKIGEFIGGWDEVRHLRDWWTQYRSDRGLPIGGSAIGSVEAAPFWSWTRAT